MCEWLFTTAILVCSKILSRWASSPAYINCSKRSSRYVESQLISSKLKFDSITNITTAWDPCLFGVILSYHAFHIWGNQLSTTLSISRPCLLRCWHFTRLFLGDLLANSSGSHVNLLLLKYVALSCLVIPHTLDFRLALLLMLVMTCVHLSRTLDCGSGFG